MITFELAAPLASNLTNVDLNASVLSFSFYDGRQTITSDNVLDAFNFSAFDTDASGQITQWNASVLRTSGALDGAIDSTNVGGLQQDVADLGDLVNFTFYDVGRIDGQPGTWTFVPEPTTALLLAAGLVGLGLTRRRPRRA